MDGDGTAPGFLSLGVAFIGFLFWDFNIQP